MRSLWGGGIPLVGVDAAVFVVESVAGDVKVVRAVDALFVVGDCPVLSLVTDEFTDHESRYKHYLCEHTPEDAGLSPTRITLEADAQADGHSAPVRGA